VSRQRTAVNPKPWVRVLVLALVAVSTAAAFQGFIESSLRFVLTPSLPRGVYFAVDPVEPLRAGEIFSFCPPPEIGQYLLAEHLIAPGLCAGGSTPLAKRLLAVSPYACAGPTGIRLTKGHLSWPAKSVSRLQRYRACGPTPPDCAVFVGDSSDSVDFRVFGCVPQKAILNRLIPIITEQPPS
jgi:type IV secretory pathway protease TraF